MALVLDSANPGILSNTENHSYALFHLYNIQNPPIQIEFKCSFDQGATYVPSKVWDIANNEYVVSLTGLTAPGGLYSMCTAGAEYIQFQNISGGGGIVNVSVRFHDNADAHLYHVHNS